MAVSFADMCKETKEGEKPAKKELPWTDEERSIIVHHVLTRVLASADYGKLFSELPDILAKEGHPTREKKACQDQWRRKISKDLLAVYGGKPLLSPCASPSKTSSPSKRKRKEEEK